MPNWCSTRMTIKGSPAECERFIASVIAEDVEEEIYDFKTKYPYKVIGTRTEKKLNIISAFLPAPQELFQVTAPVREEQSELAQQMQEKYGCSNWYDWQYENWGVKWGDCHTEYLDENLIDHEDGERTIEYSFDTPWGTASTAFLKISAMFPTLRFDFFHDEEAGFFQGCEVMKNGELVYERFFKPCDFAVEAPEWDSPEYEAYSEQESAWRQAQQIEIDGEVDGVIC